MYGLNAYNLSVFTSHFSINSLREQVQNDDKKFKDSSLESSQKGHYGYGGKFGVEKDRMDKVSI